MLTCHYSDIQRIAARLAGLEFPLATDEERIFRMSVDRHLHEIKDRAQWPELNPCEERTYRPAYVSTETYDALTELFFLGNEMYVIALQDVPVSEPPYNYTGGAWVLNATYWAESEPLPEAEDYDSTTDYVQLDQARDPNTGLIYQLFALTSTGNAPTDATKWGRIIPFDQYISLDQEDETPIGAVRAVWDCNPRIFTRAKKLLHTLSDNGIEVYSSLKKVWVEFTIRLSRLTGEDWDPDSTYISGQQAQFSVTTHNVEVIDFYECAGDAPDQSANIITEDGVIVATEEGDELVTEEGDSPGSAPLLWTLVPLPLLFMNYLGCKAAMDLLIGDTDGLFQIADREAQRAEDHLFDNLYRVQGQVPRGNTLVPV